MISFTGDNLNILISCDYTIIHNWMSFFSWYCLYKNLPNAKVFILCNRNSMDSMLFEWTKKCDVYFEIVKPMNLEEKIDYLKKKKSLNNLLVIKPSMVAIRDFGEANFDTNKSGRFNHVLPSACCKRQRRMCA